MAEPIALQIAGSNPNPFQGGVQALASGADWAYKQADVNLRQQMLQQQQQEHDLQLKQFNMNVGNQVWGKMNDLLEENPQGKVFKAKKQAFQDWAERAGVQVSPATMASLEDENYRPLFKGLGQALGSAHPEVIDDFYENLTKALPHDVSMKYLDSITRQIEAASMAKLRASTALSVGGMRLEGDKYKADKGAEATANRIENTNMRYSQRQYDKEKALISFTLDGAARGMSLIDKIKNPSTDPQERIESNSSIRSLLAQEEARLQTQKQNFGQGTAQELNIDSYATRLKDLRNKIADKPGNTISDDNLNQINNFYKEMSSQYMGGHDRMASTLLGGATPAQKQAVLGRAKAFQKQYGDRFKAYGGWQGPGVADPDADSSSAAEPAPPGSPQSQGAPAAAPKVSLPSTASPRPVQLSELSNPKLGQFLMQAKAFNLKSKVSKVSRKDVEQKLGRPISDEVAAKFGLN